MKRSFSYNKSKGFASIISMMIAISVISVVLIIWSKHSMNAQENQNAIAFRERLVTLKNAIDAYQTDKLASNPTMSNLRDLFPPNFAALSPNYMPSCTSVNNHKGTCMATDQLPWGKSMLPLAIDSYADSNGKRHFKALITFKLPNSTEMENREYDAYLSQILTLPNVQYDELRKIIRLSVYRIDVGLQTEALKALVVTRDGNNTLLDTWDAGDQAITNVKDITVKVGNKQLSLSERIISAELHNDGDYIPMFGCPANLTQSVTTSISALYDINYHFISTVGESATYAVKHGSRWRVHLIWRGFNNDEKKWEYLTSGKILVYKSCVVK